jgi:trigger factor
LEHSIKELNASEQEITVTLGADYLRPEYEKAYRKVQPDIQHGGFRKGKVPINLIKQLYGKSIEAEAEQDIISDAFAKIATDNKIHVVGQPHLHDVKHENGNLTFIVHYEVIPQITLNEYKGLVIDEPVHTVNDEEVDNYVKNLCVQNASFENTEQVVDYDHVVGIKLSEIDEQSGLALIGAKTEEMHVYLNDKQLADSLKQSLLNTKSGDTFTYIHEIPNQGAKKFQVTVNEVQKVVPAEFTDEFVVEISKGKYSNVADFREEVGFMLQDDWDKRSRSEMENNLINKIVELNLEFPLPQSIVNLAAIDYYRDMVKQYDPKAKVDKIETLPDQLKEHITPIAERLVRWELIRTKIIELEDLKVEDHDIEDFIQKNAEKAGLEPEKLRHQLLHDERFTNTILVKKTMDLLLDFSVTNEVPFGSGENDYDPLAMGGIDDFDDEIDDDDEFDDDIDFDEDAILDSDLIDDELMNEDFDDDDDDMDDDDDDEDDEEEEDK